MSQLIGYARVSTLEQKLDLQKDALKAAGCIRIFEDMVSGSKEERKGLTAAIDFLRPGDTLVVWRLDRLGRSLRHLIDMIKLLDSKDVSFKSLQENIDTNTSGGKLFFHIFGALAEFERDIIRERTRAGLISARARGIKGGRKFLLDKKKVEILKTMHKNKSISITEICQTLKISQSTLYRYLQNNK